MSTSQDQALISELSQQLQEAIQARTSLGVFLRMAEARIKALEDEMVALKKRPVALQSGKSGLLEL